MTLLVTTLILLVVLVNGWTDAPNAIAGCVSTRSMTPRSALILASVCNFTGAVAMSFISPRVAKTLYNIIDPLGDPTATLSVVSSGLFAVVLWATVAFLFGLPTSESHALISGITGAAIAVHKNISAVNFKEWRLVLAGLFATTLPPFLLGFFFCKIINILLRNADRRSAMQYFSSAGRVSAALSALLHGAQDSQKFIGIYLLVLSAMGFGGFDETIPLWVTLVCASVMTLGTALGGARIIKKVGCDMTDLDAAGGSASDAASSLTLFVCSLFGIPASTTHSKACAIMGTGYSKNKRPNLRIILQMFLAWGLTFPICGILGYIFYYVIFAFFNK